MRLPDYRRKHLYFDEGKAMYGVPERPLRIPRLTTVRVSSSGQQQGEESPRLVESLHGTLHLDKMAVSEQFQSPLTPDQITLLEAIRNNVKIKKATGKTGNNKKKATGNGKKTGTNQDEEEEAGTTSKGKVAMVQPLRELANAADNDAAIEAANEHLWMAILPGQESMMKAFETDVNVDDESNKTTVVEKSRQLCVENAVDSAMKTLEEEQRESNQEPLAMQEEQGPTDQQLINNSGGGGESNPQQDSFTTANDGELAADETSVYQISLNDEGELMQLLQDSNTRFLTADDLDDHQATALYQISVSDAEAFQQLLQLDSNPDQQQQMSSTLLSDETSGYLSISSSLPSETSRGFHTDSNLPCPSSSLESSTMMELDSNPEPRQEETKLDSNLCPSSLESTGMMEMYMNPEPRCQEEMKLGSNGGSKSIDDDDGVGHQTTEAAAATVYHVCIDNVPSCNQTELTIIDL